MTSEMTDAEIIAYGRKNPIRYNPRDVEVSPLVNPTPKIGYIGLPLKIVQAPCWEDIKGYLLQLRRG